MVNSKEIFCIFVVNKRVKNMAKGFIENYEQSVYDENGVERVRTKRKVFAHRTDGENFYYIFANYVGWMYDLKGGIALKILLFFMEHAQLNTGKVLLTTGMRQTIVEDMEISKSAFTKAIKQLVDVRAISEVYRTNKQTGEQVKLKGEYMINPEMLWKGDKDKRTELIIEFKAIYEDEKEEERMQKEESV